MSGRVLGVGYSIRSEEDFDFKQLAPALAEGETVGPDFIELPLFTLDVIAAGRIIPERLKTLKAIAANRPFGYTVHGPLAINLMDEPHRLGLHKDVLKSALEVSAELGAVHYVLHGGIIDGRDESGAEARYAQQREALAEFGPVAAAHNIIIAVENLFTPGKDRITALPSRLAQEIAAVNHPNIQACFDFSHGLLNSALHGADFMSEAKALSPAAKHLHIHDSFGQIGNFPTFTRTERLAFGEGDLHLPPGMGALPWADLIGPAPFADGVILNLELSPPYWSQLETSVAALRRYAKSIA